MAGAGAAAAWLWSNFEEISHIQKQRPRKMVGEVKLCLESNPVPARTFKGLKQTLFAPGPRDPHRDWDRTVLECLLRNYGIAVDCRRGKDSGCSRPGYGLSPPGGSCHYPHHRASRTYTGLGKQTLGGDKHNLVHTRTQEKGAVNPHEINPDLPMSV